MALIPGGVSQSDSLDFLDDIDSELAMVWTVLSRFCTLINSVATRKDKIAEKVFLDTVSSVMYRLVYMRFESGSLDEAIRLGALAFSSYVFLMWHAIKLPHHTFPTAFRDCLISADIQEPHSDRLLPWLLMIGAMSIYTETDDQLWLRPWLKSKLEQCEVDTWEELQALLKSFLWIEMLHDKPGKALFDSLSSS